MNSRYYAQRYYIPKAVELAEFPFTYTITELKENLEELVEDATVEVFEGDNSQSLIKETLIKVFPFYIYADKYSKDYKQTKDLTYTFKLVYYSEKNRKKAEVQTFYILISDIVVYYTYNLVRSIEQLKAILEEHKDNSPRIAFDTETTGLNPIEDHIVGFSIAFKPREGYYVPIKHNELFTSFNLGEEALTLVLEDTQCKNAIYMFNARFDMRMVEYTLQVSLDSWKDKIIDGQVSCFLADPDYPFTDLKTLEKHFLGIYRPNLKETLSHNKVDDFNFGNLDPEKSLFYAAQDAISTFELCEATNKYVDEMELSGKIDMLLLYRLMKIENNPMRVDVKLLKEYKEFVENRLEEINTKLKESIGDVNLNSNQQKVALFESFGLDTGVRTSKGSMSTGSEAVDAMIVRLREEGRELPEWLDYLDELTKLNTLNSSFFSKLYAQVEGTNGLVRFSYRNTRASTGRLSGGKDLED